MEDCREACTVPKLRVKLGEEKYFENNSGSMGKEGPDVIGGRSDGELEEDWEGRIIRLGSIC